MNTLSLHTVYHPKDPSRRYKGIAIVIGLHIVIGYGIISGTAVNGLKHIKQRMETTVIAEVEIPPPPPPPPITHTPKTPEVTTQTPYQAPPDTPTQVTSPLAIETTVQPPAEPVQISQPQPQVVPAVAKPNTSDLRVACPTQVSPEMPRKAIQDGAEGVVRASALIKDGVIRDITILSGPRVFHGAVKAAMLQYQCTAMAGEVVATQEFVFKLQ